METPRKSKVVVIMLGIALLASLGILARTLWQNYWWRRSVDFVADEAGRSWAMSTFHRGQLILWEINPTNDFPRFSGRRDGPFEIWLYDYQAEIPAPWHYADRRKVEAFNRQMRNMYEHPERFTLGHDERKQAQSDGAAIRSQPVGSDTNRNSSMAVPGR